MEPVSGFTNKLSFELALISRGKLTFGTIPGQLRLWEHLEVNHEMDTSLFRSKDEMLVFETGEMSMGTHTYNLVHETLKPEDHKFKVNVSHTARPCPKQIVLYVIGC